MRSAEGSKGTKTVVAISKRYAREMNEKFGYLATWLPNVQLKLGDVGFVRNQVFEPVSSLRLLDIAFAIDRDQQAADLDYTSSDAVSIQTKAAGTAAGPAATGAQADGSISISFSRADAVVFQASGCVTSKIADVKSLGDEILSRYYRDAWDAQYVVITDLVTAKAATILISNSHDAHIDLALKAQVASAATKLADADATVSVTRASGIGTRIVADKGLTPLFKVAGVKRRLFRDETFARRQVGDAQFIELSYKDLL
jgi:hypothetical protein